MSGVVVMNKSDYVRLLSEGSINDGTKFKPIDSEKPRARGRPSEHYHPLLEKEKNKWFCSAQNSFQIRSARYFRKEPDELILTDCLRHTKSIVSCDQFCLQQGLPARPSQNGLMRSWSHCMSMQLTNTQSPISLSLLKKSNNFKISSNDVNAPEIKVSSTTYWINPQHFHTQDQAEPLHEFPLDQAIRIVLPLKDQRSADDVRKDLSELGERFESDLRSVFTSRKIINDSKVVETKAPLINQHCIVYIFLLICAIKIMLDIPDPDISFNASPNMYILLLVNTWTEKNASCMRKQQIFKTNLQCRPKFDCLIYEMLFIRAGLFQSWLALNQD